MAKQTAARPTAWSTMTPAELEAHRAKQKAKRDKAMAELIKLGMPENLPLSKLSDLVALPNISAQGGVGYTLSDKVTIAGRKCQVGVNITVVGEKIK